MESEIFGQNDSSWKASEEEDPLFDNIDSIGATEGEKHD